MNDDAPRILLVEDDERISDQVTAALETVPFDVTPCRTLAAAKSALASPFDLVLLDLGLPDGDGLDLCKTLRDQGRGIPIVVVTARDEPDQRVRGLDLGADDYVVKPFHVPELVARIRSVLRRAGRAVGLGKVKCGELWADPETRLAGRGDDELQLSPREFELLLFLLRHPGRAWTRDQLLARVWGPTFDGDARTVDLNVRRLRTHVEPDPGTPMYIETVWGVGYRMREELS